MDKYSYQILPPSTLLNPAPVVLVSCGDPERPENRNMITVAWAGTVNSDPPMVSVSIRKERYSHGLISASGEFVVNLVDEKMARPVDLCGVKSGRDTDKAKETGLNYIQAEGLDTAPAVEGAPVSLCCKVRHTLELGSHDMFLANVVAINAEERLVDKGTGAFQLNHAKPLAFSHGRYYGLGERLGGFGFSVKKKK